MKICVLCGSEFKPNLAKALCDFCFKNSVAYLTKRNKAKKTDKPNA